MPSCMDSTPCLTLLTPLTSVTSSPQPCPRYWLKTPLSNNYEKTFPMTQNENSVRSLPHPFPVHKTNGVQREEGTQLLSGTENSSLMS